MSSLAGQIEKEATRLGFLLTEDQRDRLQAFFLLLGHWGQRIRLTGSRDPEELIQRHLGDAFALEKGLVEIERQRGQALGPCLDVGSGGGLPAFPLLALNPTRRLCLIEARRRKAAFLRTASFELGFSAQVYDDRLEALVEGDKLPLPFDATWSLATFSPGEWLDRAVPLTGPGGYVFAFVTEEALRAPLPPPLVFHGKRTWERGDGSRRWLVSYEYRQMP